jgi:O-methyltransferase
MLQSHYLHNWNDAHFGGSMFGKKRQEIKPKETHLQSIEMLLEEFKSSVESLTSDWPVAKGHEFFSLLAKFSGLPLPHGVLEIPHTIQISLHSTYSPWLTMSKYKDVLEFINPPYYSRTSSSAAVTLVDIYRVYGIYQALEATRSLPGDFLEVGVYKGGTAAFIASFLKENGNPGRLILCDTFRGVVNASSMDTSYVGGEHSHTSQDEVRNVVSKFGKVDDFVILPGIFPLETGKLLDEMSSQIRFAHIDVDVFSGSYETYEWVFSRMPKGGICIFDDYGTQGLEGVTRAVEKIRLDFSCQVFNLFNGQAMVVKL